MLVRTYKRRNRGGGGGGTGSSYGDEEFGGNSSSLLGKFSQEEEDDDTGPSTSSSFWNSSQPDSNPFSSSQGSSGFIDDIDFGLHAPPRPSIPPPPSGCLSQPQAAAAAAPPPQPDGNPPPPPRPKREKPQSAADIDGDPPPPRPKRDKPLSAGEKLRRVGSSLALKKAGSQEIPHRAQGVSITVVNSNVDVATCDTGDATASVKAMASVWGPSAPPTSTLMEAQESGEMMEHVDEANFALDGLRPGQPLRTRRASLVSLLSICGTTQRRRLLRTHGMVKPVLDAVLTVPTDDPPTALAAATLLYLMAYDGQDESLLDSSDCIQFLLKLLGPTCPALPEKRMSSIGGRLLALGSKPRTQRVECSTTSYDQGGASVVDKVNHLLSSMKGWGEGVLKLDDQNGLLPETPSSEWVALLTLEKACLSTVVLEDNAGTVRRIGGQFKERLRELGGLNTLSELVASCYLTLKEMSDTAREMRINSQKYSYKQGTEGVSMLLRCLKVMENVTFLSENNQKHLLDMVLLKDHLCSPQTFIGVVIGAIALLSDFLVALKQQDHDRDAEVQNIMPNDTRSKDGLNNGKSKKSSLSVKGRHVERLQTTYTSSVDSEAINERKGKAAATGHVLNSDKQNTFDFDESDCCDENRSMILDVSKKQKGQLILKRDCKQSLPELNACRNEVLEIGDKECLVGSVDTDEKTLLDDCLLSAVKVLMNLTNDNDIGCCQVAACGGLDVMASLITKHYPSYLSAPLQQRIDSKKAKERPKDEIKTDTLEPDLDLLVVVLGVLVNLVEKDTRNRRRLAVLNLESPSDPITGETSYSMIRLLCFIFLSKQGAGECVESAGVFEIDDETSYKQGQEEAEDMILEAYSALLLAFLAKEGLDVRHAICQQLPNGNLSTLVPVLERFLAFHVSLNMLSDETHASVLDVINSCRSTL